MVVEVATGRPHVAFASSRYEWLGWGHGHAQMMLLETKDGTGKLIAFDAETHEHITLPHTDIVVLPAS